MPISRPNLVRAWWPALVWISLIVVESTDYLSAAHTGSALYALLTHLFGPIDLYRFLVWHHYLRKSGHFVGYGVLALLLLRGWRATLQSGSWRWRPALLAWVGTAFVAAMDEWHQTFIPSRTGTVRDLILDSAAGLVFLLMAWNWLRRSKTRSEFSVLSGSS